MADPTVEGSLQEWIKQLRDDIVTALGELEDITIDPGDVRIGAVEIQDHDTLIRQKITKSQNIMAADDVIKTYTFLEAETDNERLSTVTYTSATVHVGETVTDTYAWGGAPPTHYLASITRTLT